MKKNKKEIIHSTNSILLFSLILVLIFSASFLPSCLSDYQFDYFSYSISNFNKIKTSDEDIFPMMTISKTDEKIEEDGTKLYTDLYSNFYYNDLISNIRQMLDGSFYNQVSGQKLYLLTQDVFSIQADESKDGGYRLDYGQFNTYFTYTDLFLSKEQMLTPRFNCDSFIFISDSYADYLLDFYNLESKNYSQLITDEQYAALSLQSSIDDVSYTFSINNIIYSSSQDAPRTESLYGYFGMIKLNNSLSSCDVHFEAELKNSPYPVKTVLKTIDSIGYDTNNSVFSFYQYDLTQKKYLNDLKADISFQKISQQNYNDTLIYFFYVLIVLCTLISSFCFFSHRFLFRFRIYGIFVLSFAFVAFSIIANFVYIYPLSSLCSILVIIFSYGVIGKEVVDAFKAKISRKNKTKSKQNDDLFSIEI